MKTSLNILFASPEAAPFAKTGGLADVIQALPKALKRIGHNPVIVIPRYKSVDHRFAQELVFSKINIPISDRSEEADVYRTYLDSDIPVYLIDKPQYYHRDELYGTSDGDYQDNAERFIFFSRAIVELIPLLSHSIDIVHCNDWQTGLIPLYLKHFQSNIKGAKKISTLFTIHNMAYQGLFWRFDMHLTGLPWDYFTQEGIEYYGDLNLLKAGIVYADALNTVSKQYCKDIQTSEFGCGLDGVLRSHQHKLHGIINGIDYSVWNPAKDPLIPVQYDVNNLDGKKQCKFNLLKRMGKEDRIDIPLIGMISRLNSQKGLNIISQSFENLMQRNITFILLGTGDRQYEEEFAHHQRQHPDQFSFQACFDESLAHLIEAGSDFYLMPSRYEPCGLNQQYSLRYGTIPIVRATGGLIDTVIDLDQHHETGTGFVFRDYTHRALLETVDRAVKLYGQQEYLKIIQKRGMLQDFSWESAADKYSELYHRIMKSDSI